MKKFKNPNILKKVQESRLKTIEDLEKKLANQKSPDPSMLLELIGVYVKLGDKAKNNILNKHLISLEKSLQSTKQKSEANDEVTTYVSELFNDASTLNNAENIVLYGVILLKCCTLEKKMKQDISYMVIQKAWFLLGKNPNRPELENHILHFQKIAINSEHKVEVYYSLAQLYNRKARYKEAMQLIEEAFSLSSFDKIFTLERQVDLFVQYSDACLNSNNVEKAIEYARKTLTLTKKSDDRVSSYSCLIIAEGKLVEIEYEKNNIEKANSILKDYKKDIDIYFSLIDKKTLPENALLQMSKIAFNATKFEDDPSKRYKYIELACKNGVESFEDNEKLEFYGLRLEVHLSQYEQTKIDKKQYTDRLIKDAVSGLTLLLKAKDGYSIADEKSFFYPFFFRAICATEIKEREDILQKIIAELKLSSKEEQRDLVYLICGLLAYLEGSDFDYADTITQGVFKKPLEVSHELKKESCLLQRLCIR